MELGKLSLRALPGSKATLSMGFRVLELECTGSAINFEKIEDKIKVSLICIFSFQIEIFQDVSK